MKAQRARRLLASTLIGLGLVAVGGPNAFASTFQDVTINNFAYQPPAITVTVGDTVRWTSNDFTTHTATSLSGPTTFDTGLIAHGQSAAVVFATPGTYTYFCQIHETMRGTINVQNAPDPAVPEAPLPVLLSAGAMIALTIVAIRSSQSRALVE